MLRGQVLVRCAGRMDRERLPRSPTSGHAAAAATGAQGNAVQPIRDVDAIRTFLSEPGAGRFLDMPWMPLYLGFVFILHPVHGVAVTVFGALYL